MPGRLPDSIGVVVVAERCPAYAADVFHVFEFWPQHLILPSMLGDIDALGSVPADYLYQPPLVIIIVVGRPRLVAVVIDSPLTVLQCLVGTDSIPCPADVLI